MIRPRVFLFAVTSVLACAFCHGALLAGESVDALVRQLGDDSFARREAAFRALVDVGDNALPALNKAARSPDPEVRWRAETAARMIRRRVSPQLARKIGDAFADYARKKWFERERLVMDVAAVGNKAALPALERLLREDKSRCVKRAAAMGLLRLGPEGLLAIERSGAKLPGLPRDSASLRIQIGNGFLEEGKYERALQEYRKAIKAAPTNSTAWYNLACALSRLKRIREAVDALKKAVEVGFDDIDWLKKDPDLDNLRDDPRYRAFVKSLKKTTKPEKPPEPDD